MFGEKGVLTKDIDGNLQCHLCGKYYRHLGSHIVHGHKMLAKEYKKEFGLNMNTGLVNEEVKEIQRQYVERDFDRIYKTLNENNKQYRFQKGQSMEGRYISEETKRKNIEVIQEYNKKVQDKVKYDAKGNPICELCGKAYPKLMNHVYMKHGLTAREYKQLIGVGQKRSIINADLRKKYREKCVTKERIDAMINSGKVHRFGNKAM